MNKFRGKSRRKFNQKSFNIMCIAGAIFVIAGVCYFWYDSFYAPKSRAIDSLVREKEKIDIQLADINALRPQLESLRRETVELEAKLDSLKNIFPDQREVPRLIRELTTVNRMTNVTTTRFTPKPDVVQEYHVENRYDVSVAGDYHDLGALFSHLANFQLIVNLTHVTITANPGFGGGGGSGGRGAQAVERQPSILSTFELTTFSSKR